MIAAAPPLEWLTETLPAAAFDAPHESAIEVRGGARGPLTWRIVQGELPSGLELSDVLGTMITGLQPY